MKFSGIYEEHPIGKEEWYLKLSEESDGYYLQAVDYFGHQIAGGALLHIRKNGTIGKIRSMSSELGLTLDEKNRIVIGDE